MQRFFSLDLPFCQRVDIMLRRSRTALAMVLVIFAIILLLQVAEEVAAADHDIFGDMVVGPGTMTYKDETIDVRGNVIVESGGTLKLENCVLAINASQNGQYGLEVQDGGRMEMYDSLVYGNDARVTFVLDDDTVIQGSEIRRIHASGMTRGIMLTGGSITIRDSVINDSNYHGLYVQTDLTLDNVTIRDITYSNVYIYNYQAAAAMDILIENSRMVGTGSCLAENSNSEK